MAKVSAHGKIIGTVDLTTYAKRYMSDGKILKNQGFGWKIGGTLKPGISPEQAYANQLQHQKDWRAANPDAAAYRDALHALCGINKRWKLHTAIQMMPEDPDGVWSDVCDGYGDNVHADIDDIVQICRLYCIAARVGRIGEAIKRALNI